MSVDPIVGYHSCMSLRHLFSARPVLSMYVMFGAVIETVLLTGAK